MTITTTCPDCKHKFDISHERREVIICPFCDSVLVRTVPLPKGEPYVIDEREIV